MPAAFGTPSALTLFFLGFGSGLPFLLVGYILSIWLREAGGELGLIGLLSYIGLFYALKFVWAPHRRPLPAAVGWAAGAAGCSLPSCCWWLACPGWRCWGPRLACWCSS